MNTEEQAYRVTWVIDVSATTAKEAAREARLAQVRRGSLATVFHVLTPDGEIVQVDLAEDEDS